MVERGHIYPLRERRIKSFWASSVNKTDIVVIELDNGKLQLNHRAVPDYAVIETEGEVFSPATQDGFTRYGVLENCVRAGFFDNSHVGNNGNPVRMTVRGVPVYMDIVHGVNNASITDLNGGPWDMSYVPYLRLKSTQTGEVIFYSQEPVLVFDEIWKEYVQDGAWVSKLSHLRGVMFAGGQVAKDPAKISEYDEFTFYTGAGDTAVARADFRLCDLMEESEMDEVGNYRRNAENRSLLCLSENALMLPPLVKGWNYEILNKGGRVSLRRTLIEGICAGETALRPIHSCAGYFDFGGSAFDGKSLYETEYGLVAAIKGFNYRYAGQCIHTVVGYGVVILSKEHPEKILYHSEHSIVPTEEYEGNTIGSEFRTFTAEELLASVPEKVLKEILMTYKMIKDGTTFSSDHKKWLESRI